MNGTPTNENITRAFLTGRLANILAVVQLTKMQSAHNPSREEPFARAVAIAKLTGIGGALVYAFGFLVIRSWGASYGLGDFPFLNSRYLAAGGLYLGMVVLGSAGWFAATTTVDETIEKADRPIGFRLILVLVAFLATFGMGCPFYFIFWRAIARAWPPPELWTWALITSISLALLAIGVKWFATWEKGIGFVAIGLLFLAFSMITFGAGLYGRISAQVGGGETPPVSLIVSEEGAEILRHVEVEVVRLQGSQNAPASGLAHESISDPVDSTPRAKEVEAEQTPTNRSTSLHQIPEPALLSYAVGLYLVDTLEDSYLLSTCRLPSPDCDSISIKKAQVLSLIYSAQPRASEPDAIAKPIGAANGR